MTTYDLPYDFEDFGMTQEELQTKYPTEHPEYTIDCWHTDHAHETTNGYWDWVMTCITKDDEEAPSNE